MRYASDDSRSSGRACSSGRDRLETDGGTAAEGRQREQRRDRLRAWRTRGDEPAFPHVASMTWRDGLFCHWPVDPAALEGQIPDPLTLDTRDGEAWISVVPFVLARAGLRGSPAFTRVTVPELNVRTYVRYEGDGGLYFFAIDLDGPALAAAIRRTTRLPVHYATMQVGGVDDEIAFSSSRQSRVGAGSAPPARFAATYRPEGEIFHAEPESLAGWLTGRRRFYAPGGERGARSGGPDGRSPGVLTAEIAHAPWPLREVSVEIQHNTLFAASDLPEPEGEPVAHYCGELEITGSIVRRLRAE